MLNLASGFTPDWHLKFPSLLWTPGLWIAASLKAQQLHACKRTDGDDENDA